MHQNDAEHRHHTRATWIDELGDKHTYSKEDYERIQAEKEESVVNAKNIWNLPAAINIATEWISVYTAAAKAGKAQLAAYLMNRFLRELVERLGKDDEEVMRSSGKDRLITADGTLWGFTKNEDGKLCFSILEYHYSEPVQLSSSTPLLTGTWT